MADISESAALVTRRDVLTGALTISLSIAGDHAFGAGQGSSLSAASASRSSSIDAIAELFRDPPQEFAPIDCWWWEAGQVDRDKLVWQLKELKEKGVGGTWFYVRWVYGESLTSIPHYWTADWWELTHFSVEQHRDIGLTHYFSNWTLTQFQQDLVRKEKASNPALEGRKLVLHRLDEDGTLELPAADELLDVAAYRLQGDVVDYGTRRPLTDEVRRSRGQLVWKAPERGWILAAIVARPWDLDYTSQAVGRRFSEAFLGEYEKRLPDHLGKTLAAFGADEMTMLDGETLFSPAILAKVRSARGYELAPFLIALFHDIGAQTDRVRCDYYDAMTALLEQNFYRAPSDWLEQRGMKHATVSQLGGGDPLEQTAELGDFFRYLRTFHEPGNEDPMRTRPGERRLMASKLSSSIAHLYGRSRVVMCVHYSSGWGMTQEENLAWTNESFAKGLNLYCRHGAYHTLMGGWYEWVPPMDHFYQPHWLYWKPFTSYVTRLSAILSQGQHRADVALFYPITTLHANWVAGRKPLERFFEAEAAPSQQGPFEAAAIRAAETLQQLAETIYHDGIDFDFLDNDSLERATVRGGVLEVAGVEFRSVVLPPLSTIRLPCLDKLREYYDAGGTIVAFERLPTASAENGREDLRLIRMLERIFGPVSLDGVPDALKRANSRGGRALFVASDVGRVPAAISGAILRDVTAPDGGLFHIHKRVGEADVYFLFNVKEERRELAIRFRTQGSAQIWDPHTGERRPVYRLKQDGQTSEVRLTMERNQGVVLVFSPEPAPLTVTDDNLTELSEIVTGGVPSVAGFDANGGRKSVWISHRGQSYVAQTQVDAPPEKIVLEGPFTFRLEPTMDNRWGDYRYPATPRLIGAEARRFRYREEEDDAAGVALGWHGARIDDSGWEDVIYSYGPYWRRLGPFRAGAERRELIERALNGGIDVERVWSRSGSSLRWEPHAFSQKFGYFARSQPGSWSPLEGLLGVPENFLVLDAPPPGNDVHYFYTSVLAPADGDFFLHVGTRPERQFFSNPHLVPQPIVPARTRVWVNGRDLAVELRKDQPDARSKVRLKKGENTVLLEVVRPEEGHVGVYAVLLKSESPPQDEPHVPLLRWFRQSQGLIYDAYPSRAKRVGWYRFPAPPGMISMQLHVQGAGVQAWVDGEPVAIAAGRITLAAPKRAASSVAVRIEQHRGSYAGAAFPEPVAFECEEGQIALGDWSEVGLATYSGLGIYSKSFTLGRQHLAGKVHLDLGHAKSAAELLVNGKSAGVKLARPFRFDVTPLVREGENRLEVKVANTLANHMSTYPTRWVLEGQTVSGLLGPVELSFHSPVRMKARKAGN